MSIPKTIAVLFTKRRNITTKLNINNIDINLHKSAKFLGVTFDNKLNWNEYINYIITRCKNKLNLLKCVSGTDWGADCSILYQLYRTLIKPVLEYGSEAFNSAAPEHKKKLDSIQYT